MGIGNDSAGRACATGVLVAAVVVLVLGCVAAVTLPGVQSARPVAADSPSETASTNAPVAAPPTAPGASEPRAASAVGKRTKPVPAAAHQEATGPKVLHRDGMSYLVELEPACARPGETITARMRLTPHPGSGGVLKPFYTDGTNEEGKAAIAESDGTLTYSWVARPIPGEGKLATQGFDGESRNFGTLVVAFRVVELTASC